MEETLNPDIKEHESTFVISHTFETDAGTLFNMWVDPEMYVRWMGPAGVKWHSLMQD